MGDTA
jgi:hypothetical protein